MAEFIGYITDVLAIEFVLGTTTLTLGGIALGVTLVGVGVGFYKKVAGRR